MNGVFIIGYINNKNSLLTVERKTVILVKQSASLKESPSHFDANILKRWKTKNT